MKGSIVMIYYVPVKELRLSPDKGTYTSVGIRGVKKEGGAEEEIAFVPDISEDFQAVEQLAKICTSEQLSPSHLFDVVEDFF